jgi:uncharacterized protein (DUF952 family)
MIYHFCPWTDWVAASHQPSYRAGSLTTQGFIHCSPLDALHEPATLLARGRTDLVVLEIDEAKLDPPAVWEDADPPTPDGRQFPHVYGPIPVAAIVRTFPLVPAPDGSFAPLA